MKYTRMPIEIESPEQMGYENVRFNLTESSFSDFQFKDLDLNLNELVLCYGDHLGHKKLRNLIAQSYNLHEDQVMLTVGAASALFIVSTSLLQTNDRLLVLRPNYATNIETPKAIGAKIDYYDLKIENNFKINMNDFIKAIQPDTKLVSITTPHNPTGMIIEEKDVYQLAQACREKEIYLLVDETYREMCFQKMSPLAATLNPYVISVSSVSKSYGLPGIRLGWLINQDPKLMELFLAAKEQIFICGSLLDEEVAYQFMLKKDKYFKSIYQRMKHHLEIVTEWIAQEKNLTCVLPEGGVVCFPQMKSNIDPDLFYKILNEKHKTFVGPGHWFEQPRSFFRLGFGWPTTEDLKSGLKAISQALDEAQNQPYAFEPTSSGLAT
jgi:aspartate/methionine/tyrosine aminotransferase